MEHLLCIADYPDRLGSALRPFHLRLLVPSNDTLVARPSYDAFHCLDLMDLPIQQDSETLGSFLQVSGRRNLRSLIYRLWVLPWTHQALGTLYIERGKLVACPLTGESS